MHTWLGLRLGVRLGLGFNVVLCYLGDCMFGVGDRLTGFTDFSRGGLVIVLLVYSGVVV